MTETHYQVQGLSDEVTVCDCCGRDGLKRTVRLAVLDADGTAGDVVHYGTTCAGRASGTTSAWVRNVANAAESLNRQARDWARRDGAPLAALTAQQYLAANPSVGTLAQAEARRLATVAEARQILAGGGLAGTRFAREAAALPVVTVRPVPVSPISQGTLF